MKKLMMILVPAMISSPALASEEADIYQAAEALAQYVQTKDDSRNASQVYRRILDNMDREGVEVALLRPLHTFRLMEGDRHQQDRLAEIMTSLGEEPKSTIGPRDISIVANASDACISKCIDDVIDGARDVGAIFGAVGVAGGPAVAGAAAAGGAVVGASVGGLKCSLSPECKNDQDKPSNSRFGWPPGSDLDRVKSADLSQILKQKRDIVVNGGPRGRKGL